jgi:adenosylmethionine-8-amino-7-oxononanoate aminotransferase
MEILPQSREKLFSDNGSTAVEIAIKSSHGFFLTKESRKQDYCFRKRFHGDTFLALWRQAEFPFRQSF